jgi:hypothetical protein
MCCVGSGLYDGLITPTGECYRVCVWSRKVNNIAAWARWAVEVKGRKIRGNAMEDLCVSVMTVLIVMRWADLVACERVVYCLFVFTMSFSFIHILIYWDFNIILQCNFHRQSLCKSSENTKYCIGDKISDHVVIVKFMLLATGTAYINSANSKTSEGHLLRICSRLTICTLLSNLPVQPTINKGLLTSLYLHLVNKPNWKRL